MDIADEHILGEGAGRVVFYLDPDIIYYQECGGIATSQAHTFGKPDP